MNRSNDWMDQNDRWFVLAAACLVLVPFAWMLIGGWH